MDKYPDMGEVTGLRLELGRMTDKANALEAALRKEVMAIVRDEIRKAQPKKMYDTKPDGTICIVAEDEEIARLKVDVEHVKFWNGQLKAENDRLRSQFANSEQENARLKAEVERLTANTDKLCKHGDLEIARLKAENERLREAGQLAIEHIVRSYGSNLDLFLEEGEAGWIVKNWNTAKEGKSV